MTQQEKDARKVQYASEEQARQILRDVMDDAKKDYSETVKQADAVYKEAKKKALKKKVAKKKKAKRKAFHRRGRFGIHRR